MIGNGVTHISSILEDEDFSLGTPRMKMERENSKQLLESCSAMEYEIIFDVFAASLIERLQPTTTASTSRSRKTLWSSLKINEVQ